MEEERRREEGREKEWDHEEGPGILGTWGTETGR